MFWALDFPALLAALLTAITCGLVGNLLVLRREAMVGDAIAHMVLPGLVGAVLLSFSFGLPLLHPIKVLGALFAALVGLALIRALSHIKVLPTTASIGLVFSGMFALGVLMLELGHLGNFHLDIEHALFGSLEALAWFELSGFAGFGDAAVWIGIPDTLVSLCLTLVVSLVYFGLLYRPLMLWVFDSDFSATTQPRVNRFLAWSSAVVVAAVAMAAFEAVGAVLVVGLLAMPAMTALLISRNFAGQLAWSVGFACLAAVLGFTASRLPASMGFLSDTLPASGLIPVISALLFAGLLLISKVRSVINRGAHVRRSI